jgi:hypothetical protein
MTESIIFPDGIQCNRIAVFFNNVEKHRQIKEYGSTRLEYRIFSSKHELLIFLAMLSYTTRRLYQHSANGIAREFLHSNG